MLSRCRGSRAPMCSHSGHGMRSAEVFTTAQCQRAVNIEREKMRTDNVKVEMFDDRHIYRELPCPCLSSRSIATTFAWPPALHCYAAGGRPSPPARRTQHMERWKDRLHRDRNGGAPGLFWLRAPKTMWTPDRQYEIAAKAAWSNEW